MWPVNSSPDPTGSCSGCAFRDSRSRTIVKQRSKSAPTRSILLAKIEPRHVVSIGLPPYRLRLRLHPGHRVEQRHRPIEHPQRPLHFDREIHVAGRVDDVDPVLRPIARLLALAMPAPEAGRRSRRDRDPALLLLLHPVHRGRAFVHLADLVGLARVVQNALGRRRLPGIDVRHDADVPIVPERCDACHKSKSLLPACRAPATHGVKFKVNRERQTVTSKNAGGPGRPRGAGIHPLPPGVPATAARAGTHGAPSRLRSTLNCPALLFGSLGATGAPAGLKSPRSHRRAHKGRRAVRRRTIRYDNQRYELP